MLSPDSCLTHFLARQAFEDYWLRLYKAGFSFKETVVNCRQDHCSKEASLEIGMQYTLNIINKRATFITRFIYKF